MKIFSQLEAGRKACFSVKGKGPGIHIVCLTVVLLLTVVCVVPVYASEMNVVEPGGLTASYYRAEAAVDFFTENGFLDTTHLNRDDGIMNGPLYDDSGSDNEIDIFLDEIDEETVPDVEEESHAAILFEAIGISVLLMLLLVFIIGKRRSRILPERKN